MMSFDWPLSPWSPYKSRKFEHRHVCAQRKKQVKTKGEDNHLEAKGRCLRMKPTLHTPRSGLPASGSVWQDISTVEANPVCGICGSQRRLIQVSSLEPHVYIRELLAVPLNKHVSVTDPKIDWPLVPGGDCVSSGDKGENDWSPAGFCSHASKLQDPSVHVLCIPLMNYYEVPLDSISMFPWSPKFILGTTPNSSSPNTICTMSLLFNWC